MDIAKLSTFQHRAINKILFGDSFNYVISMATQGGKSWCYQIPGNIIYLNFNEFNFVTTF